MLTRNEPNEQVDVGYLNDYPNGAVLENSRSWQINEILWIAFILSYRSYILQSSLL